MEFYSDIYLYISYRNGGFLHTKNTCTQMLTAGLCTAHTETTQISINYPVDKLERGHAMQYTQQ